MTLSVCPLGVAKSTRPDTSVPTAPVGAPESSSCACNAGLRAAFNTGALFTTAFTMKLNSEVPP